MSGKLVIVTGGTGFLGRHLCRKLNDEGYDVRPLNSSQDLRDPEIAIDAIRDEIFTYEDAKYAYVIHLAASVGGIGANVAKPVEFWRDNLLMGINVLDACAKTDVKRLIIAGTTCSYPENPRKIPFDESCLWEGYPEPTNAPYGIAKRCLVEGASAYRRAGTLDARVLMPTNLYGPGDSLDLQHNHVIPALIVKFLKATMKGQSTVPLWGTGSPTRDFLFVEDAADAFVRSLWVDHEFDVVNIGTGVEVSILELATMIGELTGYDGELKWSGQLGGQPRRALDCFLAHKKLGWWHETDLYDGLKKTVEWVRSQL